MKFPRLPWTKTKTQKKPYREYLNLKTAKSQLARHSADRHDLNCCSSAPRDPNSSSYFPLCLALVISYFTEKSFIVVNLTRNFKPFSEERIWLFLLNQVLFLLSKQHHWNNPYKESCVHFCVLCKQTHAWNRLC